jgi:hypothetical protein
MVAIGGPEAWLTRTKGDIECIFQWVDTNHESKEPQPCMCLRPAVKRDGNGTYILPAEEAYRFATSKGKPTPDLMKAAFMYCKITDTHPDKSTIFRVMDIILDGLQDLIRMPTSQPQALFKPKALKGIELAIKKDGQTVHEAVV